MIDKIGVIGAGQMGSGIAQVCAQAGLSVTVSDPFEAALQKAQAGLDKNLGRAVSKGSMSEADKQAILGRIAYGTDLSLHKDADLVIEVAPENIGLKEKIFKELIQSIRPDALIASNTSSISITKLATFTDRPQRFIGMHFFNPVPVMKLVEVIRGIATDDETFKAIHELAGKLGKTPAVVQDFPGFAVNRILVPMLNEACYALMEGVADIKSIDAGLKLGAAHPMGPLTLMDFIGLDTCLAVMNVLHEGFSDSKYRPCPLLVKYVEAGWLGKKTGKGFYDYSQDPPVPTR